MLEEGERVHCEAMRVWSVVKGEGAGMRHGGKAHRIKARVRKVEGAEWLLG
jgi:hypothetical protein